MRANFDGKQQDFADVDRFTYFGIVMSKDGDRSIDITKRLGKVWQAFQKLANVKVQGC